MLNDVTVSVNNIGLGNIDPKPYLNYVVDMATHGTYLISVLQRNRNLKCKLQYVSRKDWIILIPVRYHNIGSPRHTAFCIFVLSYKKKLHSSLTLSESLGSNWFNSRTDHHRLTGNPYSRDVKNLLINALLCRPKWKDNNLILQRLLLDCSISFVSEEEKIKYRKMRPMKCTYLFYIKNVFAAVDLKSHF